VTLPPAFERLMPRGPVRYTVPWVPSLRLHPDGEFGGTMLSALAAVVNTIYQMCGDGRMITLEELNRRVIVNDSPALLQAVVFLAQELEVICSIEVDPSQPRGDA
jgi:hypothetical protein